MIALIISLVLLGLILLITTYFQRRNKTEEVEVNFEMDEECCGAHAVCDKETLLNSANKIVYYDDEELDELSNIKPSNYTSQQLKQISDVFFTLKESDVAGWLRSLQLRNIELPIEIRDEALLVVSERRNAS